MTTFTEYRLDQAAAVSARNEGWSAADDATDRGIGRRNVLIFRNELIERSETFVLAQAASMQRYQAVFCGLTKKAGGILPQAAPSSLLVEGDGPGRFTSFLRKRAFMVTGRAEKWQRRCRAFHPALIHAHFGIDGVFALPLQRALDLPLVVSLHGYDVTSTDEALSKSAGGRLYLGRREQLFKQARVFLCVSQFIREQAMLRGYPAGKLWVHSVGIDLKLFSSGATCHREPIVLFVGRLVEKKGCAHLIRAMQAVQRALPATQLVMIGDGPLRPTLQEQAGRLLSGEHIFLGTQPPSVVQSWLRRAMVFCVPSVTAANGDAEGLGMVFCEAQAMGVPVVSFASGGIAEAVLDGVTGFLLREGDDAGLAQGICRLLLEPACWRSMSTQGRARMEQNFNLATQTKLLEAKYDEILTASPGR